MGKQGKNKGKARDKGRSKDRDKGRGADSPPGKPWPGATSASPAPAQPPPPSRTTDLGRGGLEAGVKGARAGLGGTDQQCRGGGPQGDLTPPQRVA